MKELTTGNVKQWFDAIIEKKKELCMLENFNEDIETVSLSDHNVIQIYKGIELLAQVLSKEIKTIEYVSYGDSVTERSFEYMGFKIVQVNILGKAKE